MPSTRGWTSPASRSSTAARTDPYDQRLMAGARRPPILQGSLTASSLIRTIRGLEHDVPAAARPLDRRAGRVLGRTGPFPGLVPGAREHPRKPARRHPSLVRRWPSEQRLPGPRPADRGGARRTDRADLRLAGDRHPGPLQLPAAARRSGAPGRRPAGPRGRQGRPGDHLHADGAAGGHGDARLRAPGRGAFGGVRWLRSLRAWLCVSTTPRRSWCSPLPAGWSSTG